MVDDIKKIKELIIDTVKNSNAGHITSSYSCTEILYTLYKFANINKENVADDNRDRIIISKEHCRLAQCCILAYLNLLDKNLLKEFCNTGGNLGHDMYNIVNPKISAVDYASGSLGHGLSVGAGLAFGDKKHHVYVLVGDGELQEGSIYEALLFISQHNIKNITIIVDKNNMQIDNWTKEIIDTSSKIKDLMFALKFEVVCCNGHDVNEIEQALQIKTERPKCIIAETIKGKGIEFLLKDFSFAKFHHSSLTNIEFEKVYEAIRNE